jgi:hypothetical protein
MSSISPLINAWYCFGAKNEKRIRESQVGANHVHDWKPTEWLKTFHPRSIGHTAIRLKIIEKFKQVNAEPAASDENKKIDPAPAPKFPAQDNEWSGEYTPT